METETKKISFFQRVKTAIFKLEDYGKFLGEKPSAAFKYFFILVFLSSILISAFLTYTLYKPMMKGTKYIENELPDFTLEDGILHFDEYVEGFDEESDFRIIINTFDVSENDFSEYTNKLKKTGHGALLLKNKAYYFEGGEVLIEDEYANLETNIEPKISKKSDLVEHINTKTITSLIVLIFFIAIATTFVAHVMVWLADICFISIVGWFIARMCRLTLKMIGSIELTIYALTLSMILNTLYMCTTYIFPSFNIEYFRIIYLLIAYVYLIAALFMIRFDLMKEQEELNEVYETEKEVKKELEQEKEGSKEEKQEEKENNGNKEDKKEEAKKEKSKDEKESTDDNLEKGKEEPSGSEI